MNFSTFLVWESALGDAFIVRGAYVKIAKDFKAGALLSRIVYYYLPGRAGNDKLRVKRNKEYWIAKTRSQWCEEIFLTERELDGALRKLSELDLIARKTYKFGGAPTLHVRLVKETFLKDFEAYLESVSKSLSDFDKMGKLISTKEEKPKDTYNIQPIIKSNVIGGENDEEADAAEGSVYCPRCTSPKVVNESYDPNRRCAYCLLLAAWKYYFPDKPQPEHTTRKLRKLAESRWKNDFFRNNYSKALKRSSQSVTCKTQTWFNFNFFVRNDEQITKMMPGQFWMEWKDAELESKGPEKSSLAQV